MNTTTILRENKFLNRFGIKKELLDMVMPVAFLFCLIASSVNIIKIANENSAKEELKQVNNNLDDLKKNVVKFFHENNEFPESNYQVGYTNNNTKVKTRVVNGNIVLLFSTNTNSLLINETLKLVPIIKENETIVWGCDTDIDRYLVNHVCNEFVRG